MSRPQPSSLPQEKALQASDVRDLISRTLMYFEGYLRPVRLSDVVLDDWGFRATVTNIGIQGLPFTGKSWPVGCAWPYLTARPGYMAAQYGGWRIYHRIEAVARIIELASTLPPGKTTFDDSYQLPPDPGQHPHWYDPRYPPHNFVWDSMLDLLDEEYLRSGCPDGEIPEELAKILREHRMVKS